MNYIDLIRAFSWHSQHQYDVLHNFSTLKHVFFKSPLKNAKNDMIEKKIKIDEEIKDIEVRTWFNGKQGKLTIKSFKIEKI